MKFAVIEYSSKTGTIWRHRDDHPNYLADPQHEMDPTSFGCYVSAMRGDHIPLRGLITGPINQVTPLTRYYRKIYKRIIGSWPRYDISYLASYDAVMVVHQISDGHEVTAFVAQLKAKFPAICIIGVPTQPYGILERYWRTNPTWLKDFQAFMTQCDVFISIVASTVEAWRTFTKVPVEYLPQPYPAAYASQFFTPMSQKEKSIYVAGVPSRPSITRGFSVAQKLQQRFPGYIISFTETTADPIPAALLAGIRFAKKPFKEWREHLQHQRTVSLVINTDDTATRGRVQVDCAAVGTPSIGANSDGQKDLFPDLPATPSTTIDELVEQGTKLLQDQAYYTAVATHAQTRLAMYDYAPSRERLEVLINKYRPRP